MDEVEKYKRRLEAIAERRRLQEEEDRIRREMEDEKIRLHQLKRKSLRDQWLMEVAPSPPTSPAAQSPLSPFWGSPAQQMDKHRLSSATQRLEQNIRGHKEDSHMEKVNSAREQLDMGRVTAAVHNGEATGSATRHFHEDTTVVVTNGGATLDIKDASTLPYIQITASRQGESLTSSSGAGPSIDSDGEEEEMMVMRAECVIITDEEDDSEVDILRSEESLVFESEAVQTAVKREEESEEKVEPADETGPVKLDGHDSGSRELNGNDPQESVLILSEEEPAEGAPVAPVPVYSEVQPCILPSEQEPKQQVELGATTTQESESPSGQFQEVPLSDAQANHRSAPAAEEQKPLLSHAKEHSTLEVEPDDISTEIHGETRPIKKETKPRQTKACQCCSIM
ncbi:paralemmin-1-like [Synchiropus splendidus]|uniref:paralemmin-1-like n=1 Tax=Synchiropus splendidus TaxID=270530 RepID=UPI00237D8729|nr:paralemmin-1-like [Synchiropus splendidus]XP_053713026.1 paralemmin-1-like [Synchiropus splendidus]